MMVLAGIALVDGTLLALHGWTALPGRVTTGALHLALTLGAMGWARKRRADQAGWDALAVPLGVVLGPGAILALAWLRPWAILPAVPAPVRAARATPATAAAAAPPIVARIADQRLRYPEGQHLQSLATVLRHGDLASRCTALQTVVRSFEPKLSPLVAAALRDPDQTVRALAAATSAQVSANIASKVARIEAEPATTHAECFAAAMLLFEHGTHNVLLSQAQRITLRQKSKNLLDALSRAADCPANLRAPVAAALVRLGAGPSPRRTGRTRRGSPRGFPELAA